MVKITIGLYQIIVNFQTCEPMCNFYVLIDNGQASYIGYTAKSLLSVGVRSRTIDSNAILGGGGPLGNHGWPS